MEKFLEDPRHIEFQVLADKSAMRFTSAIATARCSAAIRRSSRKPLRRHPPRRATCIGERCAEACRKHRLRGAGTFEFLYENDEFYFIEMNTRLQVEHPVTEMVTGIDIVQVQIRIAAGERCQSSSATSHSKVTPSNAASTPKTLTNLRRRRAHHSWHMPGGPGIRVDSHAYNDYFVPPYYDSLIGKLIAYGEPASRRLRV